MDAAATNKYFYLVHVNQTTAQNGMNYILCS